MRRAPGLFHPAPDEVKLRRFSLDHAALAGVGGSFLLFVRDLDEFGDGRVLPWLLDTYLTAGERLRHEAATSLNWVLARRLTSRFTLTAAATGPLWTFPATLASRSSSGARRTSSATTGSG